MDMAECLYFRKLLEQLLFVGLGGDTMVATSERTYMLQQIQFRAGVLLQPEQHIFGRLRTSLLASGVWPLNTIFLLWQ